MTTLEQLQRTLERDHRKLAYYDSQIEDAEKFLNDLRRQRLNLISCLEDAKARVDVLQLKSRVTELEMENESLRQQLSLTREDDDVL